MSQNDEPSPLFSKKQDRPIYGRNSDLTLLQALLAGSVPRSLVVSRDTFLRQASREVNDWPEWKKALSEPERVPIRAMPRAPAGSREE